jgi:branched-chain amino acid transport system substrate-binding protein
MSAIRIGILYSTIGPYGAIGRDCRDGALLAIERLTAERDLAIEPVFGDPEGRPQGYLDQARFMLREGGCRHVVGTITSLARKEVIPLVEIYDGLLWYMCPYEGFEANENVIYTGGCPNQHLLPLLFDYLLPRYGANAYLAGANYVWGWEMNRLARELITRAGGNVVGERYLPLEETDVGRLIADIRQRRPSFILNNLIGPSSYTFLAAMRALAREDQDFAPENCPVASCDISECELDEIPGGAPIGQLSVATYFDSLTTPENRAFKAEVAARFGPGRIVSTHFAGAYATTRLCIEAIASSGTDEPSVIRRTIQAGPNATVLGPLAIDPRTNHAALPFHLGRVNGCGGFDILVSKPAIAADPYLVESAPVRQAPHLRLVR